ncbi:hypothetical protein SISSUDRAFT_29024 [Sistotremastrum suecicum HHB10207 ss-3]|uniref:Uncharacterized protein n=1 Tax=Sistotremastrum suecicum HHB10207 ss-3 TaxID=1314776 RepID=A0A166JAN8_9AGAM|nr:hypothetical protein SISSUDRAFT_29024 [Sistotremastrum suecicum HHB10207 ss-3]
MASSVSSVSQREQTRYHSEMQRIRRPFMTIANPDPDTDSDEGNNNARPPPSHYQQSNYQYFPTNSFPHVPPPPPLPDHSPSTSGPAITPLSSNGSFHMAHASTGSAGTAASASGSSARSSPAPDTTPPPSTPGQALPAAPRLFTDVNIDASDTQGSPDGINAISRTSRDTPRSITTRAAMTLEPKLGIGFSPRSTDGHRPNTVSSRYLYDHERSLDH